jgi:hypothetical protein
VTADARNPRRIPGLTKVGDIHIAGERATGPRGETLGMPWPKLDVD